MDIRISTAISSHLSDAQHEISFAPKKANNRINFVKWILNRYPETEVHVKEEKLNEEYRAFLKHWGLEEL